MVLREPKKMTLWCQQPQKWRFGNTDSLKRWRYGNASSLKNGALETPAA
jgi:hypothetical protein